MGRIFKERVYTLHHRLGAIVIKVNGAVRVLLPYEHNIIRHIATGLPPRRDAETFAKEIILLLRRQEKARQDELDHDNWRTRMGSDRS